ncbi:hypothetical protein IIU_06707 [Bacillus cereus VD133]|uniref:Uncharacterized protein n=1 Tax=Bacillus cereus VD133 TaxID=1053233 RepID=A0A9W5PJU0_BACCE|nr:hypothetical protein IIU_06707 [Bacillus cereus VD133]
MIKVFRIKKRAIFLCLTTFIVAQPAIPRYAWADEPLASTLDKAASAILAQHDTFFKNLDRLATIDNQLKSALTIHEKNAQDNANYWLNTLEPSTQVVVKDVIGYNATFQSIYKDSIDKFASKNKQEMGNTLNTLQNDMNQKQTLVKEELDKLRKFRKERLSQNVRDFNADVTQILAKKDGEYAVIDSLNKSIAVLRNTYATAQRNYSNQVKLLSLDPTGTAAVLAAQYAREMEDSQQEIDREKSQLTQFQAEVPVLNAINDQSNIFVQNISESIDTLQSYISSWDTLNAKIKSLISDVGSFKGIDESYFIAEMDGGRESWDSIVTLTATKLSKTSLELSKGRWEFKNKKWYYRNTDGTYAKKLQVINGKVYFFDVNGILDESKSKKWKAENGKIYYVNDDGSKATGLQTIGGDEYYFSTGKDDTWLECGQLAIGWIDIHDTKYSGQHVFSKMYFGKEGDGTGLKPGQPATGWKAIDGKEYYFGTGDDHTKLQKGQIATGWTTIGGDTYYFFSPIVDGNNVSNKMNGKYLGQKAVGWADTTKQAVYFDEKGHLASAGDYFKKWLGK